MVVVAITQTGVFFYIGFFRSSKALRVVVGKGSLSSAIEQGLVDPKAGVSLSSGNIHQQPKGKYVNIHIRCGSVIFILGRPSVFHVFLCKMLE